MPFSPQVIETSVNEWPAVRLLAGDVSIGLTPDIGGRIMSLTFRGEELLYAHAPEAGKVIDLSSAADIASFKKEFGFRIFGGDRTWVAPEKDWVAGIPPIDLDVGRYLLDLQNGECSMVSPVCRETGLQVIRRIRMEPDGTVGLEETLVNTAFRPVLKGIWNVCQVRRPFDVYFPSEEGDFRSYHHEDLTLPDPPQVVQYREGWGSIACRSAACFKFGGVPRSGQVFTVKSFDQGVVVFARGFYLERDVAYAHGSAVEVFNSSCFDYGEVEIHAPLIPIPPGGRVSLQQEWRFRCFPAGTPALDAVRLFSREWVSEK